MPRHDAETEAAIRHLLKGEGKSRSGTFMVTVHGGRIVAIAPIGGKLSSKALYEEQLDSKNEAPIQPEPTQEPRDQPREPSNHPAYGGVMLLQEGKAQV